ncbi:hypothetical protein Taro_032853 [Colocasia esculenta]|uniref:Uncharacterized protein n=1 Tax=Colocasia esculenta TaxID=4460 RepID=A0A843VTR1_COLES|nr:hypothetical protein [Colocasia esculenta]
MAGAAAAAAAGSRASCWGFSLPSPLPSRAKSPPPPPGGLVLFSAGGGRSCPAAVRGLLASRFKPAGCSSGDGSSHPAGDRPPSFCIIEGPETVQDFIQMQLQEIRDNIRSRRNKIFLLMEEVRRLRVQQRIKSADCVEVSSEESEMLDIPSTIPFIPRMVVNFGTLFDVEPFSHSFCLLAPVLELKLGLGGTSYADFIKSLHLPLQLSQVDPIVASFSGGAVGVISALMLIEINNVEQQEKKRCKYCHGTGYLACARCSASGMCLSIEPISIAGSSSRPLKPPKMQRCPNCSGAGKVCKLTANLVHHREQLD